MKNENGQKQKFSDEYRTLQRKLFIRTAGMFLLAVICVFLFYSYILHGNFANLTVRILQIFTGDYDSALHFYKRVFRDYMELYFLFAVLAVFLVVFRLYLKGFTKYFNEINRGIDALLEESPNDIILSPELGMTEKKINSVRHTLRQRKIEAEIAEQRKNDLVVYLAHDLKTPLTSVIGYLTLLRDENRISEELREKYLSISLDKAERLEELINEFFEITRFSLSNITLEYSRVNLTRLLEQLTYEFKPMFLEKDLTCELKAPPDLMILCDVNKIQRVFDNLLRNAVNYSFEHGTVSILVTQNNHDQGSDYNRTSGSDQDNRNYRARNSKDNRKCQAGDNHIDNRNCQEIENHKTGGNDKDKNYYKDNCNDKDEHRQKKLSIRFINHGNTIPQEKLARIFEQFYRLDSSRSSGSGGAGLGLAIAKEIVELHHGTITAKSEDEIIEFEVVLPAG